jgi:hypothetical protein
MQVTLLFDLKTNLLLLEVLMKLEVHISNLDLSETVNEKLLQGKYVLPFTNPLDYTNLKDIDSTFLETRWST